MKTKKGFIMILVLVLLITTALTGCGGGQESSEANGTDAPALENVKKYEWRLASTWADGTFLFEVDKRFAELVEELSNGELVIKPYAVGQLGEASQVFDLVSNGSVECGGDWPSYWTGKNTGFDLLATNIMGFTAFDYYVWIYEAGGLEDGYNYMFNKYNMVYFPTAITGMESGIRSNKPINSLEDMKGMKMRLAGKIQGLVAEKFGITPVSIAANEIYEALQRGVIDAAEYSGPYNDDVLKIQEVAKSWLTPGWHQSSSAYGVMINQDVYNSLPDHLKRVIDVAAKTTGHEYMAKYQWNDAQATARMLESDGVTTTILPEEDMRLLEQAKTEALEQMASENPDYKYVLQSQINYLKQFEKYRTAQGKYGFGYNWEMYPNLD